MQYPSHLQDTPDEILTHPLVEYLLDLLQKQSLEIERLKAEVRLLKGHSAKPTIPPSSNLEGSESFSDRKVKKNSF